MKTLLILVSSMLLFVGFAVAQTATPATKSGPSYTCSMHPEIASDKPGTCPKCGMDLVQKASVQYTCPMHPEVISDSPVNALNVKWTWWQNPQPSIRAPCTPKSPLWSLANARNVE